MNVFVVITYLSVVFCFGVMFGAILEWKRLEVAAANEYRLPLTPMFILILLLIIAALGAVAVSK